MSCSLRSRLVHLLGKRTRREIPKLCGRLVSPGSMIFTCFFPGSPPLSLVAAGHPARRRPVVTSPSAGRGTRKGRVLPYGAALSGFSVPGNE